MSHGGGGGGGGMGHGGGGHHGGGHHGGGHPDQLPSWNSALQGGKRTGRFAYFSPKPIFVALFVFSVMLVPFVLDWDEPHLQRLLIGHDLTAKEIAHQNAVNQAVAGTMRSQASHLLGSEVGDALVPAPPVTGASIIAEPPSSSAIPDSPANNGAGGGMGNFSISAGGQSSSGAGFAPGPAAGPPAGSMAGFSLGSGAAPPGVAQNFQPASTPTLGSNHRFISQPGAVSPAAYTGPRYKVVVDR